MRSVVLTRSLIFALLTWIAQVSGANEIQRGQILVANEALSDPNFDSSVVLIIGHNNIGTLGLILNRPLTNDSDLRVPEKYNRLFSETPRHFGGPVPVSGLRLLVDSAFTLPNSIHVLDSIYFLDNPSAIDYLLDEPDAIENVRLFLGISSWIPGQLAAEISAGAWYVVDADSTLVFSDSKTMWERLITRIHAKWVNISRNED